MENTIKGLKASVPISKGLRALRAQHCECWASQRESYFLWFTCVWSEECSTSLSFKTSSVPSRSLHCSVRTPPASHTVLQSDPLIQAAVVVFSDGSLINQIFLRSLWFIDPAGADLSPYPRVFVAHQPRCIWSVILSQNQRLVFPWFIKETFESLLMLTQQ